MSNDTQITEEMSPRTAQRELVERHHKILRQAFAEGRNVGLYEKPWGKKTPRRWAEIAKLDIAADLPNSILSRDHLYAVLSETTDCRIAASLVLAWGEMRPSWAAILFANPEWLELLPPLRGGFFTRFEAYERFHALNKAGRLPGMGPAFFTKLIFFLRPGEREIEGRGYIMDQWTGASVNLLHEQDLVILHRVSPKALWVTNHNTADRYERFNQTIEYLARQWECSGENVEQALFGKGGKTPDLWRAHVRCHAKHRWAKSDGN